MKRYILVQSITGIDLVARDIAKAAALPDDSDTMELPDGTVLSVGALRSHTMEWLKALCQKYHLCPVGSKTKEALITTMVLATKITARQVGDEVEAFIRDTKDIDLSAHFKEDVLPDPVPQYKFNFNLQDIFDHYFSSVDVKIHTKDKYGRLFEIYVFFGVVNAWTMYMELLEQHQFKGNRTAYLQSIAYNKRNLPSRKCNIRTVFVKELCEVFYNAKESDKWLEPLFM